LVTIDPEIVAEWAQAQGIPFNSTEELITNDRVQAMIEREVAEKNKEFASYETIKKITIVPEFTIENGLLTPTMKLKKNVAVAQYAEAINAMYPDDQVKG
jgi:long-chain acyl-CoA synthetase